MCKSYQRLKPASEPERSGAPDATNKNERNLREWDCQTWLLLAEAETDSKRQADRQKRGSRKEGRRKHKGVRTGGKTCSSASAQHSKARNIQKSSVGGTGPSGTWGTIRLGSSVTGTLYTGPSPFVSTVHGEAVSTWAFVHAHVFRSLNPALWENTQLYRLRVNRKSGIFLVSLWFDVTICVRCLFE